MVGALVGAGAGLLTSFLGSQQENEMKRIREKEVDQALRQNLQDRQRLTLQSPEAVRQQQAMQLQNGRAGALAQAGAIGAGSVGQSGFAGGDIGSGNIAGIKASAPIMAAAGQYDQGLASLFGQRQQQENTINQQLGANTMDRGRLAEMTAYTNQQTGNPYQHLLSMIQGGANLGNGLDTLFRGDTVNVENEQGVIDYFNQELQNGKSYDDLANGLDSKYLPILEKLRPVNYQNMLYGQ